MTLTLELSPELEQRLQAEAQAHHQDVQAIALSVLERHTPRSDTANDFMALLAESAPRIAAGTRQPFTSDDISQAIAEARPGVKTL